MKRAAMLSVASLLVTAMARGDAPLGRYKEIDAALVLDTKTGLTWQRKDGGVMNWASAQQYCAAAGGGFRLPTVKELATLLDEDRPSPPNLDAVAFPDAFSADKTWSSTPVGRDFTPDSHWVVDFDQTIWSGLSSDDTHYADALCVK